MNRTNIIESIRDAMRSITPRCKTILFGSEARGESTQDSDIDLLILVEGDTLTIEDELKISAPLNAIEFETGVMISPLIMLRKSWENRPINTPFSLNIQHDGIIL